MRPVPLALPETLAREILENEEGRWERQRLLRHRAVRDEYSVGVEEGRHECRRRARYAI